MEVKYHIRGEEDDSKIIHIEFSLERKGNVIVLVANSSDGYFKNLLRIDVDGRFELLRWANMEGLETTSDSDKYLVIHK